MSECGACLEQGARQAEQLRPREPKEGLAMVARTDALSSYGHLPLPDVRLGDVVRVELVAAAIEAGHWCTEPSCPNYEGRL